MAGGHVVGGSNPLVPTIWPAVILIFNFLIVAFFKRLVNFGQIEFHNLGEVLHDLISVLGEFVSIDAELIQIEKLQAFGPSPQEYFSNFII